MDAQLVVALLERHGIACRVQPLGASAFPTAAFGVQVLVSEDDLARAQATLYAEGAAAPPATDAWQCDRCGAVVDADLDECWSCGPPRDESAGTAARETDDFAPREPRLPIFATIAAGFRLVIAYPLVFVATVPLLAWAAIATAIGLPGQDFVASESSPNGTAELLSLPGDLFFGPLGRGFAIAIAGGSARGSSSWSAALGLIGRRLPALMVLAVIPTMGLLLISFPFGLPGIAKVVIAIAFLVVGIRLIFAPVAVVVDDVGPVEGLTRSWGATHTAWWRTFGLMFVVGFAVGVVAQPISWAPPPFRAVLACGLDPIVQAILVVAYLRLARAEPVDRSMVGHLPPIPVPAV